MQRRKYALLKQPFELDALGDVSLTNPVLGDVLYYDGSYWVNQPNATFSDVNETITGAWTFSTYYNFTPSSAPAYAQGRIWYDSTAKAISYYNDEADVTVNVGQEMLLRVRNTTGATITNGTAVYINGSAGASLPTIAKAQANALTTARCIGLATHDIENNSNGYICTSGEVNDLDTSAYSAGDVLYLSTSVAGGLTTTRPTTGFAHVVGVVTVSNPAIGSIKVLAGITTFRSDLTSLSQNETITGSWTFNANPTLGTDVGLVFDEHASAPSTPSAGTVIVYAKADGKLYIKDDAGTETDLTATGGGGARHLGAAWGKSTALTAAGCADVHVRAPITGTISGVYVLTQGGTGSCVIDIWKDSYANFPPTVADTITAAAKPTISSGTKYSDTTLTGWTTSVTAGDILTFHVDSTSTFTNIVIYLTYS